MAISFIFKNSNRLASLFYDFFLFARFNSINFNNKKDKISLYYFLLLVLLITLVPFQKKNFEVILKVLWSLKIIPTKCLIKYLEIVFFLFI